MHQAPLSVLTGGAYHEDEYFNDLMLVTKARPMNRWPAMPFGPRRNVCRGWRRMGGSVPAVALGGTLSLSRTNAFFLGGGKALVNAYYNTAEDLGVTVRYEAQVSHIGMDGERFRHVEVSFAGAAPVEIKGRAVVLASGGFQSDLEWLTRAWGPAAANFLIRGTPYNRGVVLRDMLDQGCESVGDPTQCHAVASMAVRRNSTAGS